jgi:AcrR family transcriptional regulator
MDKDQILLAAAQIFRTKGFHAASMQDIAEAVKLQKASLYYHVSSKQEILLELLDRALDIITEEVGRAIQTSPNPAMGLQNAIRTYLLTILAHQDLISVLLLEHRSLEPEMRARHIPRRDRFENLWREVISQGTQQGYFYCENPALAARAILGTLNWTITWYRPEGSLSAGEIAEDYVRLFLKGLQRDGNE